MKAVFQFLNTFGVELCCLLSILVMIGTFICAWKVYRSPKTYFRLSHRLCRWIVGTVIAVFVLFFGIFCFGLEAVGGTTQAMWFRAESWFPRLANSFLLAVYQTVCLFTINCGFDIIQDVVITIPGVKAAYTCYGALLYLLAPGLTATALLSFLSIVNDYVKYWISFPRNVYVFSELNNKSLALATNIVENFEEIIEEKKKSGKKQPVIIFTDVTDPEKCWQLRQKAREINSLCFRRSMSQISFAPYSKKANIHFFAIKENVGEDESINAKQGLEIIQRYHSYPKMRLYVLTTSQGTELMLHTKNRGNKLVVRCINDIRSLVYKTLYDMVSQKKGDIFGKAGSMRKGVKQLSAIVVGMGAHGTEMLKALSWFGQMDGYTLRLDGFDADLNAESRFQAQCPELMERSCIFRKTEGDANCDIHIHAGVDVLGQKFAKKLQKLMDAAYVFVSLGDDDLNIRVALMLRMQFQRWNRKPIIQAIVYDPDRRDALQGIVNFKGEAYDIDFIGDLKELYSCDVILNSELERKAFFMHTEIYGGNKDEKEFWAYEYNYRSSMAAVIHYYARKACGVPKADHGRVEQCRWNAYMRSDTNSH